MDCTFLRRTPCTNQWCTGARSAVRGRLQIIEIEEENTMKLHRMTWLSLLAVVPVWAQPAGQIEPNAGTWKTWAISSTTDYRVPPPPDAAAAQYELQWLHNFVGQS